MKTLYVTLTEWLDVLDAVRKNRGSFGGFQSDLESTVSAIGEVFGPDVAAQCGGGVRVEIVTELPPYTRLISDVPAMGSMPPRDIMFGCDSRDDLK